ncbi:uncharacterized protein [Equus przewalskii]|uniref:Uncharacterized protein isoform X1 n=1 Tax=Equus przewalskii TaxID=9798 RepID=A0ABM4Q5Y0_EQUPR
MEAPGAGPGPGASPGLEAALQKLALRRKKVLSAEEMELYELVQAAGGSMDPDVFTSERERARAGLRARRPPTLQLSQPPPLSDPLEAQRRVGVLREAATPARSGRAAWPGRGGSLRSAPVSPGSCWAC